jgi:S-adenosylmethionine decarboxylase
VASEKNPFDDWRPAARRQRIDPDDHAGVEWIVDAFGCMPEACQSLGTLGRIIEQLVDALDLHPLHKPIWQTFEGGGITGMLLHTEGKVTCHSVPELAFVAFNLFCSDRQPAWRWDAQLSEHLGAARVVVRELIRG